MEIPKITRRHFIQDSVILSGALLFCPNLLFAEGNSIIKYSSLGRIGKEKSKTKGSAKLYVRKGMAEWIIEEKGGLNDKPNQAVIFRSEERFRDKRKELEGKVANKELGEFYRKTREQLVFEYVERFKEAVMHEEEIIKSGGEINTNYSHSYWDKWFSVGIKDKDQTLYEAKADGSGITRFFEVDIEGKYYSGIIIDMKHDYSDFAEKAIGDLVKFAFKHQKFPDKSLEHELTKKDY